MHACPRAWAITYGTISDAPQKASASATHPPRTLDELLIRCMRAVWLRRLDDQYQRKLWTAPYAKRMVDNAVDDALDVVNMRVPELNLEMGKERSRNQLRTLERCQTLRPLFTGQPRRWAYFDRRTPAKVGSIDLYAAPDVAIFHQHHWTLVRIQFRSSNHAILSQQLEHLLMIHWAMNQPGFPQDAGAYRVKVVRWHGEAWRQHTVHVSEELLAQSLALALHDIQEMTWLQRWASGDPSFESLPLARHPNTCTSCRLKTTCPANNGLASAKRAQEQALLGTYNDATKSAKTA